MAATYYNISADEMHEFLSDKGFSKISVPHTVELVYGKRVDQDDLQLSLRVYTGINPSGESRSVGKDAIRVTLFMRLSSGKVVKLGGDRRVHRVTNWKKNLSNRLNNWLEYVPEHKCCCGNPMLIRTGKGGQFLGCANYPECKETRNLT